jgi:hypothetical protein
LDFWLTPPHRYRTKSLGGILFLSSFNSLALAVTFEHLQAFHEIIELYKISLTSQRPKYPLGLIDPELPIAQ